MGYMDQLWGVIMEMSEGLGTNVVSKGRELMGIKLKCYIL